jgi:hypothetical protein
VAYKRIPETSGGGSSTPADNSVTAAKIVDGSVGTAELADGTTTPAKAAALVGIGGVFVYEHTFTASGTPTVADDVALSYSNLPAGTTWKQYDAQIHTETGGAASATAQVFTAVAGGGTQVTTSMSCATSNVITRQSRAFETTGITNATTHQMRRTGGSNPSGTAGKLRVFLVRTA